MWDRAKLREQFVRLTVAGAAQADLGRALGNHVPKPIRTPASR